MIVVFYPLRNIVFVNICDFGEAQISNWTIAYLNMKSKTKWLLSKNEMSVSGAFNNEIAV